MTKAELIEQIAQKTEITKTDASKALDATIDAIIATIKKGQKVTLVGFGTFVVSERQARQGRNPRTGEEITIPSAKVPKFIPAKGFKEAIK